MTDAHAVFRQTDDIVEIGPDWLARLKAAADTSPMRRARVCLHRAAQDAVHEMIIALCQDVLFRPHRHPGKTESFHLIEGALDLVIFDEAGTPLRTVQMGTVGSGKTFCYRLNASLYHALLPRTPHVVFHETTSGPFVPGDGQFAPWAPEDAAALRAFIETAMREPVDQE